MRVSCTPGKGQLLLVLALGAIFGMLRIGLDIQAMELKKRKNLLNIRRTQASLVRGRSYISWGKEEEWATFNNCIAQPWASEDEESRESHS